MNCSACVIKNMGRMTRSIFHRNFRNCEVELAGSTHDLSMDRTRKAIAHRIVCEPLDQRPPSPWLRDTLCTQRHSPDA